MVFDYFNGFYFYALISYFFIVNILSLIVFYVDKRRASRGSRRVPEKTLHFFELIGGVFFILPSMYFIRHKNRKFSYFIITYFIFFLWLSLFYLCFFNSCSLGFLFA